MGGIARRLFAPVAAHNCTICVPARPKHERRRSRISAFATAWIALEAARSAYHAPVRACEVPRTLLAGSD
jgi:hypothetical protein